MKDETKDYIKQKLIEMAEEHNIKILFAVESGSRAWGFPSQNSDYDVRFVYARQKDDYLSVLNHRDVIEVDIAEDDYLQLPFDLNGWDIRKALQLALKSNAVLIEWLASPITYIRDDNATNMLCEFVHKAADISLLQKHYYKTAMGSWKQIEENIDVVKLKLYCYAFRPALALAWIDHFNAPPPMDMDSLLANPQVTEALKIEIQKFIALKNNALEGDIIERNSVIDSFIDTVLANYQLKEIKEIITSESIKEADKIFRQIIL